MELQTEDVGTAREGLIAADRRRGQTLAAIGQIECVSVPAQDGNALQRTKGVVGGVGRQVECRPADLLARARVDRRAQRRRHELRAKADAHGWPVRTKPGLQKVKLVLDHRIGFCIVDTDRTAQNHKQISLKGIDGAQVAARHIDILDVIASVLKNGFEAA